MRLATGGVSRYREGHYLSLLVYTGLKAISAQMVEDGYRVHSAKMMSIVDIFLLFRASVV